MTTNTLSASKQQINRTQKLRLMPIFRASLLSMLIASAADLGLYYAAGLIFPEVTAWQGAGPGQIVGANVVYLLLGAVVFFVVTRFSSRPVRTYLIAATVGLLLSLGLPISAGLGYGPPGTPSASAATAITLTLMHLVSYAVSVPLFLRLGLEK